MAFLPTGLVKATGQRFTTLPTSNPVGFFFEAMYQTGPYWHFIGVAQVVAAVLLLIPATATLGAVLFLPIGASIFLITWGVGFGNTVFITGGMLLAVVYLVCWDGDRVWSAGVTLFGRRPSGRLLARMHWLERTGWILGTVTGVGVMMVTRGFVPRSWTLPMLAVGIGAVALVVLGWVVGGLAGRGETSPEAMP